MAVYGSWVTEAIDDYMAGKSLKMLLVTSAFEQDVDMQFRDDVLDEVVGTGYTAGGVAVTGLTVTYDAPSNQARVMFDDVSFGDFDVPDLAGCVLYVDTGTAATDVLLGADIFGPTEVEDVVNFTYSPSEDGFLVGAMGDDL